MKQTAKVGATKKDTAKSKVTQVNLATAAKKVVDKTQPERETKYIYPDNAKTPKQRKEFRRTARSTRKKYEKILSKLKKSNEANDAKEFKKQEHEFETWKKEIYSK